MRRPLAILFLASLAAMGGCAATQKTATPGQTAAAAASYDDAQFASATATALVFRPPIAEYAPPIDLDRDARQPAAFVGYEDGITETYLIQTDDRQGGGGWGYGIAGGGSYGWGYGGSYSRYERRAYIEKTGTLHR